MGKTKAKKNSIVQKNKEISQLKNELDDLKHGGDYTLVKDCPMTETQLQFILGRTPEVHVRERPVKGGGKAKYVTGTYVKKALNFTFAWRWNFEIVDKGTVKDGEGKPVQIWVHGKLTVMNKNGEPVIIKEQFGGADVKYFAKGTKAGQIMDYGNDLKAAATDALKKCASEIGLAGDVYGENEFKDITKKPKPKTTKKVTVKAWIKAFNECKDCDTLNKLVTKFDRDNTFTQNQMDVIMRTIELKRKELCV